MSGLFQVTVAEALGNVAIPADLDRLAVVMGWFSASAGMSSFFLSGAAAEAVIGYGDASDDLAQIIEQRQAGNTVGQKFPAAAYVTGENGSPGVYGVLDASGVTGTVIAQMDATTLPFGTYEAKFKVIVGAALGATPPPTFQWALDHLPTWSNTTSLVSTSYTVPNSGVKWNFGHAVTGTTDVTAGGLYGGGGSLNGETLILTVNSVGPTTLNLSGAGNTANEAAFFAAIHAQWPSITATAGGAGGTKLVLTNLPGTSIVIGAGTANTNLGLTAGTYTGTFNAGDTWKVRTLAPTPSTADIDAAFVAMAAAPGDFAIVVCEFPVGSSNFAHITTGLNTLLAAGKRCTALCRTRVPAFDLNLAISNVTNANPAVVTVPSTAALTSGATYTIAGVLGATGVNGNFPVTVINGTTFSVPVSAGGAYTSGGAVTENDAAWNVNVAADVASLADSRIHLRAAYQLITDAMTTRQYLRADLGQYAADAVRVERFQMPDVPADQPMAGALLSDANGVLVGHDEGPRGASTGLSDDSLGNRFGCVMRLPDPLRREAVFSTVPWVMYSATDLIRNLPTRRVANALERSAVSAGTASLGGVLFYTPADPSIPGSLPTLTETSRIAIHGVIFGALTSAFADDIQNADDGDVDTGLVQVAPTITVSGGNLLTVSVTLSPRVLGYLLKLSITLAIQE